MALKLNTSLFNNIIFMQTVHATAYKVIVRSSGSDVVRFYVVTLQLVAYV